MNILCISKVCIIFSSANNALDIFLVFIQNLNKGVHWSVTCEYAERLLRFLGINPQSCDCSLCERTFIN
jgi:recombinational DNA repair protein (RecF pathway)